MPPKPRNPVAAAASSTTAAITSDTPLFLPSALDDDSDDDSLEPPIRAEESPIRTEITPGLLPPTATPAPPAQFTLSDDGDGDGDGDSSSEPASDDDDDPVVCSYNIQITSPVAPDLYVFQYPVRSRQKPYTKAESSCPVEARFKPRSGLVEVDVPVNVHVNYDEEKGKTWGDVLRKAGREAAGKALPGVGGAAGANKRRKVEEEEEDEEGAEEEVDVGAMDFAEALKRGRVLDRQTLGSRIQADNTKYMVGVFKNDQLYLTPITSTLQLRPQFHHVDTAVEAERAASKAARDASAPQKPQEARAVHLSVKNSDDPSSQLSNTMKALRVAEEEEWTKLHWVDQDTEDAWEMYEVSCLKEGEGGLLKNVTGKAEYMEWLSTGKPIVKKKEIKVEAAAV
ncbi:uncharacterized protein H6S33_002607 [Morchella sextelata]|uniref:uncharacterized protein n=1 Tax=Morchella sextelata TaxID=1174677 RepID=UPI001D03D7C5|nr:uncharacterized protein H6S33_002607 [Morchella sextelata]KAH0607573.1 hypothetical protein H6S33_002607 [Morchella sextelata]